MKNYTLNTDVEDYGGKDYSCIQCVVTKKEAFVLLQTLASQLHAQEVGDGIDEIRLMMFGDLKLLQEIKSNQ